MAYVLCPEPQILSFKTKRPRNNRNSRTIAAELLIRAGSLLSPPQTSLKVLANHYPRSTELAAFASVLWGGIKGKRVGDRALLSTHAQNARVALEPAGEMATKGTCTLIAKYVLLSASYLGCF